MCRLFWGRILDFANANEALSKPQTTKKKFTSQANKVLIIHNPYEHELLLNHNILSHLEKHVIYPCQ